MTKGFNSLKAMALAAALALAVAAPMALAQTGDRGWHGGMHGKAGFFLNGIDLTDAQKTQLQQMHETHRQAIEPLAEQVRAKRQELWKLNDAATFDEGAAAAKLAEIAPLEAKLMAEQHRMRQEMLNVLTPEQRTQLEQRREQWKQQKGDAFKGGRHGRHGGGAASANQ
jgi:protein CpxP